jgi:predicted transcriptional regulator
MHRISDMKTLTETQTLARILRYISERKNEDQIAERFDRDTQLVKTWLNTLKQTHFVTTNYFDELVITSDGKNHLEKYDSYSGRSISPRDALKSG